MNNPYPQHVLAGSPAPVRTPRRRGHIWFSLLFAAFTTAAFILAVVALTRTEARTLRAQALVIVDHKGDEIGRLGLKDNRLGLFLEGHSESSASLYTLLEGESDGPTLLLTNASHDKKHVGVFTTSNQGSQINMSAPDSFVSLEARENDAQVHIYSDSASSFLSANKHGANITARSQLNSSALFASKFAASAAVKSLQRGGQTSSELTAAKDGTDLSMRSQQGSPDKGNYNERSALLRMTGRASFNMSHTDGHRRWEANLHSGNRKLRTDFH